MYMYIYPLTKVISLSEKAYNALRRMKRGRESFSDVVIRLTRDVEPKSLLEFAGRWTGDDIDEVFESVLNEREVVAAREYRI